MDTSILLTTNALLSSAAALIMLVVLRTRKTYPGFGYWTLGVACLALGAGLLVPDLLPPSWTIRVLRNALLVGGQMLILRGLLIFRGYRIAYWPESLLGLSFLLLFGLFSLDSGQLNARIVVYCLFSSVLSFATVGIALRQRPAYFGSNDVLLALWLSIYGVLSLVRIAHQLSDPRVSTAFEAMKGFGSLYAMAQILTVQLVTLTLISMNSQRIEHAYRQSEARLRESEEQLRSIGDNLPDGFVYQYRVVDGTPRFNYVSAGVQHIFGLSPSDLVNDAQAFFDLIAPESLQQYFQDEAKSARELSVYSGELLLKLPDGRQVWMHFRSRPQQRADGSIQWNGVAIDISSHKHIEHELELLSQTDPLTNLKNRRHFIKMAEQELARSMRYNRPLSLLMIDLDHFKNVNDTYGHHAGDRVLEQLGGLFRESFREEDLVGRMGGEEFAVILPETPLEKALEVAERFRQTMAATPIPMDHGLPLHCALSVGVTTLTDSQTNLDTLMSQADKALYDAKDQGRNKVCCWSGLANPIRPESLPA